jgi:hypothetical protein
MLTARMIDAESPKASPALFTRVSSLQLPKTTPGEWGIFSFDRYLDRRSELEENEGKRRTRGLYITSNPVAQGHFQ